LDDLPTGGQFGQAAVAGAVWVEVDGWAGAGAAAAEEAFVDDLTFSFILLS
jgi:hypothetical protein